MFFENGESVESLRFHQVLPVIGEVRLEPRVFVGGRAFIMAWKWTVVGDKAVGNVALQGRLASDVWLLGWLSGLSSVKRLMHPFTATIKKRITLAAFALPIFAHSQTYSPSTGTSPGCSHYFSLVNRRLLLFSLGSPPFPW